MCDECYCSPHLSGCPEEDLRGTKCSYCGDEVFNGEYLAYADEIICEACLSDFDISDLLDLTGFASVNELLAGLN